MLKYVEEVYSDIKSLNEEIGSNKEQIYEQLKKNKLLEPM